MSQRRKAGEWVWLQLQLSRKKSDGPAYVKLEEGSDYCQMRCEDPRCREWTTLVKEDGTKFRYINECEMFDTREEAST